MIDPAKLLSNPVAAVGLRSAFGAYIVYMARRFYLDPTGYFRKSARAPARFPLLAFPVLDLPWLAPVIRALAVFCLWGGCFIVAAAIAVQALGLHGDTLALVLIALSAVAAWLLLPSARPGPTEQDTSADD